MIHCPDREQLELLLANRLADTVRDELELHVEDCDACHQTLEALTNATVWDLEPRHHLRRERLKQVLGRSPGGVEGLRA